MSTANKLTYLNDTKQELKQKINNLGGDITDNTTFRQYADKLQNVYDILPKTSYAEGSNITLSNTLKGKLDFENDIVGYGDIKQEGTPTPDNPQEIEVVRGKNRFGDTLRQGVTNYQTGTYNADNTTRITTTNWLTLPKGTYTISAKNSVNKLLQISNITFDTNGNYYEISGTTGQWKNMPFTITFPQDTKWQCNIGYSDGSAITPSQVSEIQIEKGSQATSYLPYNTIEVVERGKNLAHIEAEGKYRSSASGNFSINANYNGYIANVRQNTTYTGGFTNMSSNYNDVSNLCYFDKNMIFISGEAYNTANKTFTTPSNCAYVTMAVKTTIIDFQLEQGSTATTYEPYQTPQTYQLSLGEYEFAKIGNYVDTIEYDVDEDKVYKNEYISKVILNGSETIGLYAGVFYLSDITNYAISNNIPYCTHFKGIVNVISGTTSTMANNEIAFRNNIDAYRLYIRIDSISEGNALKTWLSTNKPMLYYALATPTKTEITGTLKDQIKALYNSHSFTGTTIIEINGNLPLIIKVRALKGE